MADYHNLIYYKDVSSLYVNLYVASDVTWSRPEGSKRRIVGAFDVRNGPATLCHVEPPSTEW